MESDRVAIVADDDGNFNGCVRALGRWRYLESNVSPAGQGDTQVTVTALSIAGRYALLEADESNEESPSDSYEYDVFDLANGRLGEIADGDVIDTVISTRGTLAYTLAAFGAPGTATESLDVAGNFKTLDRVQLQYGVDGPDFNAIGDLRFHGQTLTWTHEGQRRSAHVAP